MSSNYPPGSMMGSGIYARDITKDVECLNCNTTTENAEGSTDDWGHTAFFECGSCGAVIEVDISPDEEWDEGWCE